MVVSCTDPKVNLILKETDRRLAFKNPYKTMDRKTLGYVIITLDIMVSALSVFFILYLERNVGFHVKNFNKLTLETKEFSLYFTNFPRYKVRESKEKEN